MMKQIIKVNSKNNQYGNVSHVVYMFSLGGWVLGHRMRPSDNIKDTAKLLGAHKTERLFTSLNWNSNATSDV